MRLIKLQKELFEIDLLLLGITLKIQQRLGRHHMQDYDEKDLIDSAAKDQAMILSASHPSGLSVYRTQEPFLYPGDSASCGHFKEVNRLLGERGESLINWT